MPAMTRSPPFPFPLSAGRDADPLADALTLGQVGIASLDASLRVRSRAGRLSDWLPEEGEPACDSPLLLGFESSLAALRDGGGEIVLPSLRLPGVDAMRVTISIHWAAPHHVVVTTPDHGAEQINRLMASQRRERDLLQQQAEAATARLRVADALYRDIVESSGYFVLRFGPDLKVIFANRTVADLVGVAQDQLPGRDVASLFPAPRPEDNPWRVDMAAAGPALFELPARDPRGHTLWLAFDARAATSGEFQAVARDVSAARLLRAERDKAREEARAAAVANERLRIAHDLHDTLARSMVTLIAQTRVIARITSDPAAREELLSMEAQARSGLQEVRDALGAMRAQRREDEDFSEIVAAFVARLRDVRAIDIRVDIDPAADMPRETRELFVRILREALRNIELHSGARRVGVDLRRRGKTWELDVLDDGAGFDPAAPTPGHFGVAGMRERAAAAGATLDISSAPGKGARVTLRAG